jgi:hypothetical protein
MSRRTIIIPPGAAGLGELFVSANSGYAAERRSGVRFCRNSSKIPEGTGVRGENMIKTTSAILALLATAASSAGFTNNFEFTVLFRAIYSLASGRKTSGQVIFAN